jgi:hypothetical protein
MKSFEIEAVVSKILTIGDSNLIENSNDPDIVNFRTNNKTFYETIVAGEFDPIIFKKMMQMKRRLENGEDQYSVDIKFGEFMKEIYIDPILPNAKKTKK